MAKLPVLRAPHLPRTLSHSLADNAKHLDSAYADLERLADTPVGTDPARTAIKAYIAQRRAYNEALRDLPLNNGALDASAAACMRAVVDETDYALLGERASKNAEVALLMYTTQPQTQTQMQTQTQTPTLQAAYARTVLKPLPDIYNANALGSARTRKRHYGRLLDKAFARCVVKAYVHAHPRYHNPAYCPVTKAFVGDSRVEAAQLVPFALGEANVAALLGVGCAAAEARLCAPENGLPLYRGLGRMFAAGSVVFVPDFGAGEGKEKEKEKEEVEEKEGEGEKQQQPRALKTRVLATSHKDLDRCIRSSYPYQNGSTVRLRDLDNAPLAFVTAARPDETFLYLRALVAWALHKRRCATDGARERSDVAAELWRWSQCRSIRGQRWLAKPTLLALAAEIGDLDEADLDEVVDFGENADSPTESTASADSAHAEQLLTLAVAWRRLVDVFPADDDSSVDDRYSYGTTLSSESEGEEFFGSEEEGHPRVRPVWADEDSDYDYFDRGERLDVLGPWLDSGACAAGVDVDAGGAGWEGLEGVEGVDAGAG
ncbi:uncharacterized protein K452DRAFT_308399 [Aplosporella prunicola CBS 121167]|uniref:HNH nuclease domain-containing protein n=1 Tax=Aplosporella prunicola CBS 121167 TaxID=1176127 RepID=A0A6A6BCW2_9PEZI|nr:uncharacterized protein K452DRAFT_308399 [Aplosporella prunicola CBS 121167]KAF2141990.1 hypothetical protein K452DRAFT_308399 [Aplosporella prunicola CBS 121167]